MGTEEQQRRGEAAANGKAPLTEKAPANGQAAEKLHEAISQLHQDIQKVEVWAGALSGFTQPIPSYEPHCDRYALTPQANAGPPVPSASPDGGGSVDDGSPGASPIGIIAR